MSRRSRTTGRGVRWISGVAAAQVVRGEGFDSGGQASAVQDLADGLAAQAAAVLDVVAPVDGAEQRARFAASPGQLGDHPQGLTRDTVARALGWDLNRVESALHDLDVRLATVGLRINADGATIWIEGAPGMLQPETRVAFDRQPGDGQVNPDLGQAVWVATFGHDLPDGPPEGLAEAFRRNLVEASSGRSRGSDAVRFSLMLAEHGR